MPPDKDNSLGGIFLFHNSILTLSKRTKKLEVFK